MADKTERILRGVIVSALFSVLFAGGLAFVTSCGHRSSSSKSAPSGNVQRANSASDYCAALEGSPMIARRPDGGEYGVCVFEDNRQCEQLALYRGDCPEGGARITGYATPAGRYCAITGGTYAVVSSSGAEDERGTCTRPDGRICDADAYYRGVCR